MPPVIEVSNLCKTFQSAQRREGVWGSVVDLVHRRYATVNAVDNISFSVQPGELLGYIGPNGAGKSTSIKMLTGILRPSSGELRVLQFHPFRDRRQYTQHIGVVFGQRTQLWWDIAVVESLKLLAKIYHVSPADYQQRVKELDRILSLQELLHTPVRKLSLGQRMRCDLAASLLHRPEVLFLDEPTIGLDAVAKDAIRTFLRQVNKEFGTTIILTTHDLKEIEELCQRILILDKGKIVYDGALSKVKVIPGLERKILIDFTGTAPLDQLSTLFHGRVHFEKEGERRITARYDHAVVPTADIVKNVISQFDVADMTISEPSIDDVIMKIYREGIGASGVSE